MTQAAFPIPDQAMFPFWLSICDAFLYDVTLLASAQLGPVPVNIIIFTQCGYDKAESTPLLETAVL